MDRLPKQKFLTSLICAATFYATGDCFGEAQTRKFLSEVEWARRESNPHSLTAKGF